MKKHFWDLIEALRRENCFVCDQRNMNFFLGRIRHVNDMTSNTTNGLRQQWQNASIGSASQGLETTIRRLRVLRHSAIGVAYYPPSTSMPQMEATHQG